MYELMSHYEEAAARGEGQEEYDGLEITLEQGEGGGGGGEGACETLHVTRHTSHVTRHTSHVTRHTSRS
jgi:hypothetical protein